MTKNGNRYIVGSLRYTHMQHPVVGAGVRPRPSWENALFDSKQAAQSFLASKLSILRHLLAAALRLGVPLDPGSLLRRALRTCCMDWTPDRGCMLVRICVYVCRKINTPSRICARTGRVTRNAQHTGGLGERLPTRPPVICLDGRVAGTMISILVKRLQR